MGLSTWGCSPVRDFREHSDESSGSIKIRDILIDWLTGQLLRKTQWPTRELCVLCTINRTQIKCRIADCDMVVERVVRRKPAETLKLFCLNRTEVKKRCGFCLRNKCGNMRSVERLFPCGDWLVSELMTQFVPCHLFMARHQETVCTSDWKPICREQGRIMWCGTGGVQIFSEYFCMNALHSYYTYRFVIATLITQRRFSSVYFVKYLSRQNFRIKLKNLNGFCILLHAAYHSFLRWSFLKILIYSSFAFV